MVTPFAGNKKNMGGKGTDENEMLFIGTWIVAHKETPF